MSVVYHEGHSVLGKKNFKMETSSLVLVNGEVIVSRGKHNSIGIKLGSQPILADQGK